MGISNNTRSTYDSAKKQFMKFAKATNLTTTLPIDSQSVVLWITWLFASDLAVGTVRTYLYGLASWHVEEGHPSPLYTSHHVWRCWKGMKRWKGEGGKRIRLPITTSLLNQIKLRMRLDSSEQDRLMWAAFTLGAYGLLRLGEFTIRSNKDDRVLRWRHIDWYTASGTRVALVNGKVSDQAEEYRVLLEASKTDPFRKGVTIRILAPTAVHAMKSYCNKLIGPIAFNAPVFNNATSKNEWAPLHRDAVVKSIQLHLSALGKESSHYIGHSFRKGGAQSLAEAGVSSDVIQAMGRWSSDCYKLYISTPQHAITAAGLALEPSSMM